MQAVVLGVPVYRANLGDVVRRQREARADAASPVDEPGRPPSNLGTTGSSTIDAIRVDGWRLDVGSPEDRGDTEPQRRGGAETPTTATAA